MFSIGRAPSGVGDCLRGNIQRGHRCRAPFSAEQQGAIWNPSCSLFRMHAVMTKNLSSSPKCRALSFADHAQLRSHISAQDRESAESGD
jgi:hypothetical protein